MICDWIMSDRNIFTVRCTRKCSYKSFFLHIYIYISSRKSKRSHIYAADIQSAWHGSRKLQKKKYILHILHFDFNIDTLTVWIAKEQHNHPLDGKYVSEARCRVSVCYRNHSSTSIIWERLHFKHMLADIWYSAGIL